MKWRPKRRTLGRIGVLTLNQVQKKTLGACKHVEPLIVTQGQRTIKEHKGDRFIFSTLIFLAWRLQRRCRKGTSRCLGKGAWFSELFALSSSAWAQSLKLE
jgi:hypothetical protein